MNPRPTTNPTRPFALIRRAARALFHTLFGAAPNDQLWARMVTDPVTPHRPPSQRPRRAKGSLLRARRHAPAAESTPTRPRRRHRRSRINNRAAPRAF